MASVPAGDAATVDGDLRHALAFMVFDADDNGLISLSGVPAPLLWLLPLRRSSLLRRGGSPLAASLPPVRRLSSDVPVSFGGFSLFGAAPPPTLRLLSDERATGCGAVPPHPHKRRAPASRHRPRPPAHHRHLPTGGSSGEKSAKGTYLIPPRAAGFSSPSPRSRGRSRMVEAKDNEVYEEDLVDYEEEVENVVDGAATNGSADVVKKGYVGIHSSGFRDFLLKPELLRAIQDCGAT
ncbi:hypothetical protein U9M48_018771 [Paspalum notatum var. saurae]|uniref:Uncharacterized protein n=1 Tax=Paspalum notatum var. saurae TaxID=547442 RepID=A0AAQ3TDK7_PASNO